MDSVATVPVNGSTVSSSQGNFQQYMGLQSSQTTAATAGTTQSRQVETKSSSRVANVSSKTGSSQLDSSGSQSDGSSQTVSGLGQGTASVTTKDVSSVAEDGSVADTVAQAVQEVVEDVLQVDDAAADAVMSQMGISYLQLLQPEVLQEFVLEVHEESDITQLLTSEEMLGEFASLTEGLEDLDWESLTGMSQQEFTDYLDSVVSQEDVSPDIGLDVAVFTQETETSPMVDTGLFRSEVQTDGEKISVSSDSFSQGTGNVSTDSIETSVEFPAEDVSQEEASELSVVQETVQTVLTREGQTDELSSRETEMSSLSEGDVSADMGNLETASVPDGNFQESFADSQEGTEEQSQNPLQEQVSVTDTDQAFHQQVTTMADFLDNMVSAVSTEQSPEAVNMQQMIDIVNQVVEQIHSTMEDGATTLEMQLNPESLGKLLLSVTNKNGVMTASFTVQSTEAKIALESQMITLRENLEQKNLKVEAVEVSVSDFAFSQSGQADTGDSKDFQQGNGRRSRFRYDEEESETEEDAAIQAAEVRQSVMRDMGSSIDFTA
jgi:flagellar hook-length control protein FliK